MNAYQREQTAKLIAAGFRPANKTARDLYREYWEEMATSGPTTGNPKGGEKPAANPEPATATERNGDRPIKPNRRNDQLVK